MWTKDSYLGDDKLLDLLRRVLWAAKRGPAKTQVDLQAMHEAEQLLQEARRGQ